MAARTPIECVNKTRPKLAHPWSPSAGSRLLSAVVARRRQLPEGAIEDLELRFSAAA